MDIYLAPDDVFESLKTFVVEEVDIEPWPSTYTKEMHPRYGIPRPDVAERNRTRKGYKWPEDKVHYNCGRQHSEETKNKHRTRARKLHSEETKLKMSESAKQRESNPELKAKRSAAKSVSVTVDGVVYSSKKAACEALHVHRYQLERLI